MKATVRHTRASLLFHAIALLAFGFGIASRTRLSIGVALAVGLSALGTAILTDSGQERSGCE